MNDFEIRIEFHGCDSFPESLVGQVAHIVEQSLYENEKQLLDELLTKFSTDIQEPQAVAARSKFEEQDGHALMIKSIDRGSLVVFGVATALAYFVIKETVGVSFKEAWTKTNMHKQLKDFFLTNVSEVPSKIANLVNSKKATPQLQQYSILPMVLVDDQRRLMAVRVDVSKRFAPSYGEMIDDKA